MRTGEMKYVILRIDTHVLRIDLCPRKRTRIRRQKQDEDVHLFLSERKKARASADGLCRGRDAGRVPEGTRMHVPGAQRHTPPTNGPLGANARTPGRPVGPPDHSPGRNPGRRNPGTQRHTPPKRASGPEWMNAGDVYSPRAGGPNGTYPARPGFRPDRPHTRGFAPGYDPAPLQGAPLYPAGL